VVGGELALPVPRAGVAQLGQHQTAIPDRVVDLPVELQRCGERARLVADDGAHGRPAPAATRAPRTGPEGSR
jgi:hypothetical protein